MAKTSAVEAINEFPVEEWNRHTVADGQWLNDNDIVPLSSRDQKLAEIIDELDGTFSNSISALETDVNEISSYIETHAEEWGANKFNAGTDIDPVALTSGIIRIDTNSSAVGTMAFAEGSHSLAKGDQSHAEGLNTSAMVELSHSEGNGTLASAQAAHAEGSNTSAIGIFSHAEGNSTIASGNQSHAEGGGTRAEGDQSHAEGGGSRAIGSDSHAEGGGTSALGPQSHAEGGGTLASGDQSHSEGIYTSAIGAQSHAAGSSTIASGDFSFSNGAQTSAISTYSYANGLSAMASGDFSKAHGRNTETFDDFSDAYGSNISGGGFSFTRGSLGSTYVSSSVPIAFGMKGIAGFETGNSYIYSGTSYSVAFANNSSRTTLAQGGSFSIKGSSAFGVSTALGQDNLAGNYSLTIGSANTANTASYAFGKGNNVTYSAIAYGEANSGTFGSYLFGVKNQANASGIILIGHGLRGIVDLRQPAENLSGTCGNVILGRYNKVNFTNDSSAVNNTILMVGNGTDDDNRSNAMTLSKSGDMVIAGELRIGNGWIPGQLKPGLNVPGMISCESLSIDQNAGRIWIGDVYIDKDGITSGTKKKSWATLLA